MGENGVEPTKESPKDHHRALIDMKNKLKLVLFNCWKPLLAESANFFLCLYLSLSLSLSIYIYIYIYIYLFSFLHASQCSTVLFRSFSGRCYSFLAIFIHFIYVKLAKYFHMNNFCYETYWSPQFLVLCYFEYFCCLLYFCLQITNIKEKCKKMKWWILKRLEECDTYLTHVCRYCWSRKSIATVLAESYFSSSNVYRGESGRCHTPPVSLIFFYLQITYIIILHSNKLHIKITCNSPKWAHSLYVELLVLFLYLKHVVPIRGIINISREKF